MPNYRRHYRSGGTYFFTVTLLERAGNDLLVRRIEDLRSAVRQVRAKHPFTIHGWVVLPDHLHCIWELPQGDSDFSMRWRLIKSRFSRAQSFSEPRSPVRERRGERGIWQRRYWEHTIRDEKDYTAHLDYIHFNPVKHGLVSEVADWPYSTFRRYVREGVYPEGWGQGVTPSLPHEPE